MTVDLEFLSKQNERVLTEMAGCRDDMRILMAIVMRLDGTREHPGGVLADILQEVRAIRGQIQRIGDRVRKLESVHQ